MSDKSEQPVAGWIHETDMNVLLAGMHVPPTVIYANWDLVGDRQRAAAEQGGSRARPA